MKPNAECIKLTATPKVLVQNNAPDDKHVSKYVLYEHWFGFQIWTVELSAFGCKQSLILALLFRSWNFAVSETFTMDLIKEDLCLFNEILLALNGTYSSTCQINLLKSYLFDARFSTVHTLPQVAELLHISTLYSQVNFYFSSASTGLFYS